MQLLRARELPATRMEIVQYVNRMKGALVTAKASRAHLAASLVRLAMKARDVRDLPGRVAQPRPIAFALYLGGAVKKA